MRHWTIEERQKQAALIKQWQPWKQSTGAKTTEGQSISKMNAYKHGARSAELRNMAKQLTTLKKMLTQFVDFV